MNINIVYNPYLKENTLSHENEQGIVFYHESDRLSRLRTIQLEKGFYKNNNSSWKGLFQEIYESLLTDNAALCFTGTKHDYEKLLAAYKQYEICGKNQKIRIEFSLYDAQLASDCDPESRYFAIRKIENAYCWIVKNSSFHVDFHDKFWNEFQFIYQKCNAFYIGEDEFKLLELSDKIESYHFEQWLNIQSYHDPIDNGVYIIYIPFSFISHSETRKNIENCIKRVLQLEDNELYLVFQEDKRDSKLSQLIRKKFGDLSEGSFVYKNKSDVVWLERLLKDVSNQSHLIKARRAIQLGQKYEKEIKQQLAFFEYYVSSIMSSYKIEDPIAYLKARKSYIDAAEKILDFMELDIEELMSYFDSIVVKDGFMTRISGIDGGWVEAIEAVKRFTHFTHTIEKDINQHINVIYHHYLGQIQQISTETRVKSSKEEYPHIDTRVIEPKRIKGESFKNKYWNTDKSKQSVEYFDLKEWEEHFLYLFGNELRHFLYKWLNDKKNVLQEQKDQLWQEIIKIVKHSDCQLIVVYLKHLLAQINHWQTVDYYNEDLSDLYELQLKNIQLNNYIRSITNKPIPNTWTGINHDFALFAVKADKST